MKSRLFESIKNVCLRIDRSEFPHGWSLYLPAGIIVAYFLFFGTLPKSIRFHDTASRILLSPQSFFAFSLLLSIVIFRVKIADLGLSKNNLATNLMTGLKASIIPFSLVLIAIVIPVWVYEIITSGRIGIFDNFAKGPRNGDIAYLLQLLVLAPIFEEIFFRGLFIPPLKKYLPAWAVILISSLIFMSAHGYLKFGAFLLGLFTSVLFMWSRSVVPGIIFHFTCNLWGPLLVYLFPNIYKTIYFLFR